MAPSCSILRVALAAALAPANCAALRVDAMGALLRIAAWYASELGSLDTMRSICRPRRGACSHTTVTQGHHRHSGMMLKGDQPRRRSGQSACLFVKGLPCSLLTSQHASMGPLKMAGPPTHPSVHHLSSF